MSKRKHAHHEEEHENHERWLVSYADMMTLLFALFLVLYAMSVVDLNKFKAFRQAFTESLYDGVQALPEEGNPPIGDPHLELAGGPPEPTDTTVNAAPVPPASNEVTDPTALEELKKQLEAAIAAIGLSQQVSVALDDRGVAVYVTDGVLFDSGKAQLKPEGQHLLQGLMPILAGVGNKLIVEGHTDNVPIRSSSFPSNWELSTGRATAVLHGLLGGAAIDPNRVSVAGYADTRPRVANDNPENRAVNRRVEVIVAVPPAPVPVAAAPAATDAPATDATATDASTEPAPAAEAAAPAADGGH
jgi:chemotaxis protein MotB